MLEAADGATVTLERQPGRDVAEAGRGIAPGGGPPPGKGARGVARGCERGGGGEERGAEEITSRSHGVCGHRGSREGHRVLGSATSLASSSRTRSTSGFIDGSGSVLSAR